VGGGETVYQLKFNRKKFFFLLWAVVSKLLVAVLAKGREVEHVFLDKTIPPHTGSINAMDNQRNV
jgi:hypothetical protein